MKNEAVAEPLAIRAWMERKEVGRLLLYVALIIIGTGLFGTAMGSWRDPLQALYTALKFPLMTVLLVGFAPVAWVFSQSTNSLPAMGVLHFLFWVIATWFGLRFLNAGFAHLSAKPGGTRVWAMIFLLVMLQMTTALRPLIGKSDTFWSPEKKFFLNHWMETMAK